MAGNDRYFITAILLATLLLLATMAGVAGASEPAAAPPGAAGYNASVLPLANGYWTKTFDGAAGLEDGASAVCCDPMGDAFVAGTTNTGGGAAGYVLWIRKYSGTDGATLWTKTHASPVPGPGNASARGVSCDPEGNPVVAGFVWNGTDLDIWVRKYRGADGATLWTKTYDGGDVDVAQAVSCDPKGDTVVAGFVVTATGPDVWVRKYDGTDGSTMWTKTYDGGAADIAYGVSCDGLGNPFVAGQTLNANSDSWIRKYDGTDGSTIWTRTYDGGIFDVAWGVACDGNGDAVAVGAVAPAPGTTLAWARKYNGDDGSMMWNKTHNAGWNANEARGVACDSLGDAIITGRYVNAAGDDDLWVSKLKGSSGDFRWSQSYTGPAAGDESANGVAIDYDGNPFVAGVVTNAGANQDIWVRKYPPGLYGSTAWFLAEGSTGWGFDQYLTIQNPNAIAVDADVTYMVSGSGAVAGPTVPLPPFSQATVNPRDTVGSADFSTRVVCRQDRDIAVDRTMTWTGPGAASPEGHNSIGVTFPAKNWYLAEGSSGWGFECWLLIQNPNALAANCEVTYMIEGEGPRTFNKTVPPRSRNTFNIADDIGAKDASIKVSANVPVIPERAMYRNNRREGHDSIGTKAPAPDYYLAEGTTAWGFTTYVLIQNPNNAVADVTVTYMTPGGPNVQPAFAMPANSRHTIRVNDVLPNTDLSTKVSGTLPIIAERAMYWNNGTGEACHDSIGMPSAHTTFWLPDGQTSDGRETWTLVQNPNGVDVNVLIGYLTPTGVGNVAFNETIPANSRRTFSMADKGIAGRAAVSVVCTTPDRKIMVERAMYWNNRGAGTSTIGGYTD